MAFDETATDARLGWADFRKNDVTQYGPSSHCRLMAFGPSAAVFEEAHSLTLLFYKYFRLFAFVVVTLSLCVRAFVDKSLVSLLMQPGQVDDISVQRIPSVYPSLSVSRRLPRPGRTSKCSMLCWIPLSGRFVIIHRRRRL